MIIQKDLWLDLDALLIQSGAETLVTKVSLYFNFSVVL